jgi:hypothetical protein
MENYEGSSALMLRQTPLLTDQDSDETDHPLVLARNVKSFKIECWDARLNDWVDEWKNTNQLPKCVRLTLKLEENSRGQPMEEIMRIISLPSIAVARVWQGQGPAGAPPPGFQPGGPGQPGTLPPGAPGGQPGAFPPGGYPGGYPPGGRPGGPVVTPPPGFNIQPR